MYSLPRKQANARLGGVLNGSAFLMVGDTPKLDRIDLRILAHLQRNGRVTNVELADAVGLSASPCLVRVKRLEKAGYIQGYGAHIQMQKLGDTQIVFTEVTRCPIIVSAISPASRRAFVKWTRSSNATWSAAATTIC